MNFLVTGAAGFIGSTLVEALAKCPSNNITALDLFLEESYPSSLKKKNISNFRDYSNISFKQRDLRLGIDMEMLENIDCVINQAAMPGLTKSWAHAEVYFACNSLTVSKLCEALKNRNIPLVHVSTSSVYGKSAVGNEDGELKPVSPYGVSKLAAENLLRAYNLEFDLQYTTLRYFSVYGPRQRPDMAYNIIIDSIINNREIVIYGDGFQTRTNTYVDDIVEATIRAASKYSVNGAINIGGKESFSLIEVIKKIEELLQKKARLSFMPERPGDQRQTRANSRKAFDFLDGWTAATSLEAGLIRQIEWQLKND